MVVNLLERIYEKKPQMTAADQKIAAVILQDPAKIVDLTISQLAKLAVVSEASISRFCRNLNLVGFHQLKIELAQSVEQTKVPAPAAGVDDWQSAIKVIEQNKQLEISGTLANFTTDLAKVIIDQLTSCRLLQVAAEGNTFPVAADAVYRFNQIGILAVADQSPATALAQTLNLTAADTLLVISNSGESKELLKQVKVAKQQQTKVIAITNRNESPLALQADWHLKTVVRQQVLQSEYYFSRVAAMTAVETLFLLMIAQEPQRKELIKRHEELTADMKV
ncbi:RpiR family transcriptional regulator [Liquorilactobacillus ghanensis DSM 18630]|jgi:DNA-binding MurR/RpiR family transcriptional regulator|uniref:RpiR family transcriptional regulator n=1 Tax=Liquorilactobacillus ghanensis DSM 18630 TaxID=1423750 RepID=A0A0R1VGA8_9LACO|nr:MurR/RpiR family transcriptional regulator [Liquorilactobacillus ghanensis]KRM04570.1 RpiR family transcriptional regulator [Liquorilactobacillus ghanensis DSM 18630]